MNNEDLQQLKALAIEATPGKWIRLFGERTVYDRMEDGCRGNPIVRADQAYGPKDSANLDFIAACSPSTILALIARIESLAADAERLDFVIEKGAFITWSLRDSTIKQCQLMNQDEDEDFHHLSGDEKYFNTVRGAIDAAIAKEKA